MNNASYTANIGAWLEKYPVIGLPVHVITVLFHYITSFRWVIDLVRWMVTTAGNIAESAFLLATVYVTTNAVAHPLVIWVLPGQVISTLNQISTMAFSVLPELIIASAMKTTFDHWKVVWRTPRRIDAWIWACSYTLPTLVFLIMTILTISTFVNFEAVNATPPQATGLMLVTRCLAGWGYGMVQILFVSIGKQGYIEAMDALRAQLHHRDEALSAHEKTISTLQKDMATLQEQIAQQEHVLFEAQMTLATRRMTRSPLPGAKSLIGMAFTKPGQEQDRKSGPRTTQPVDRSVKPHGQDSEQSLDSTISSTMHATRLKSPQPEDATVQSNSQGSEQLGDTTVQSTVQSNGPGSEQEVDATVLSSVHTTRRTRPPSSNKTIASTASKNKSESSEAARRIQRILRRNPNTGPTELAAKAGVSRSYASLVKSQFLTALAAEQSA